METQAASPNAISPGTIWSGSPFALVPTSSDLDGDFGNYYLERYDRRLVSRSTGVVPVTKAVVLNM
jgi:hypothetical protein